MAPGGGGGAGPGGGGRGGFGGGGNFTPPVALAPADLAKINSVLKALIGKADPAAQAILDANPTWNPITPAFGGGGRAGGGGGRRGGGGAGGAGGPGGAPGGAPPAQ